ncbi:MAG: alpha/beta fold hydrolase [Clostridia bacterium]|nr:alpha/beta fold hydrolase [Clostridia bacterium]
MLFDKTIKRIFKSTLLKRHDPDGSVFYFDPEDFGLEYDRLDFKGDKRQILRGRFYKKDVTHLDTLVVFEHGMGNGHKAYMREIATVCEAGYEVFAYDHTGTLESEGEHIGGFSQSLADLDHAITAVKQSGRVGGRKLAVIGHSWGGFSTMNIPALHKDIDAVVALSGYVSPIEMIRSALGGLKGYADLLFEEVEAPFGHYAYADARYSLALSATRALIIHSEDDSTCPVSHFDKLKAALSGNYNVTFMLIDGKRHNPTFTADAVVYKDAFFRAQMKLKKKKKLATPEQKAAFVGSYDWNRMTEQDGEIWARILGFIKNK